MRDNEFDRLRSDVLAAFPRLTQVLSEDLGPRQRELLDQSRGRLEQGTCHVVIVGEFKRGKSTLLNALVERPGLFPADVDVATCAVSTLAWGTQEAAVVHMSDPRAADGSRTHQVHVGLDRLPEFVTEQGNPRNHKQVRLVEIQAPAPRLETGLVLVDTPGVGSVNPEHTAAAQTFLERADGLVFVCDAIEPLATYELDFLDRALAKCEVVITVVTKTDKVRDASPVVNGARDRIAARTGHPPDRLVVVPVSASRKLKWLRDRADDRLLADSGFPELDRALWEGLATSCGAVQLRRAMDALSDAVTTAGSPVVNELAALESDESLQRIRREVGETTDRIKHLSAGGAEWRTELRQRFDHETRPTRTRLQTALDAAVRGYQENVAAGQDPEADELVGQVTTGMLEAFATAHNELTTTAATIMEEFARRTSLDLRSPHASEVSFAPTVAVPTVPLNVRPARFFDQFRASWSTGMAGMGAGAMIAAVEPVSGTAVALGLGVIGLVQGVRNHRKDLRERAERERAAQLRQLIIQEFAVGRQQAITSFNQAYGDIAQSLIAELNAQLAAQQESLAESGRRLQEVSGRTKAELTKRRGVLLARQQTYRHLQDELDRLRTRVERLAAAGPRQSAGASRQPPRPTAGAPPKARTTTSEDTDRRPSPAAKDAAADDATDGVGLGATEDGATGTATPDDPDPVAPSRADTTAHGAAEAARSRDASPEHGAGTTPHQTHAASFDPDQFDAP